MASVSIACGLVIFGMVSALAVVDRRDAADAVAAEATPLLLDAQNLYISLAQADAAASTTFLQAGNEDLDLRKRYLDGVTQAGQLVEKIAAEASLSPAMQQAIDTIAGELPRYSGYVETARANKRLDFPVGAAYLGRAAERMRNTMLPAATALFEAAAGRLYDAYRTGTSDRGPVGLIVAGAGLLAMLVVTQMLLTRRTRRVFNLGLVAATGIVVGAGAWALFALNEQQDQLVHSHREGSDQVIVLSTTRILALRALSDENLDLAERGTEQSYMADFSQVTGSLGQADGSNGLLAKARDIALRTASDPSVDSIVHKYSIFLETHRRVRDLAGEKKYDEAIRLAVDAETSAARDLDVALESEITEATTALESKAVAGGDTLHMLAPSIAVLAVVAIVLVFAGLELRIKEYR